MAAMTRGTALVPTIAGVLNLTGRTDLTDLEDDSELAVATLLIAASDAIYDQVEADGVDPTTLDNAEVFERAVAWHFLAMLAKLDLITAPGDLPTPIDPYEWSDPYYARVRAKVTTVDGVEARRPDEFVPLLGNRTKDPVFGPKAQRYYTRRPERRDD